MDRPSWVTSNDNALFAWFAQIKRLLERIWPRSFQILGNSSKSSSNEAKTVEMTFCHSLSFISMNITSWLQRMTTHTWLSFQWCTAQLWNGDPVKCSLVTQKSSPSHWCTDSEKWRTVVSWGRGPIIIIGSCGNLTALRCQMFCQFKRIQLQSVSDTPFDLIIAHHCRHCQLPAAAAATALVCKWKQLSSVN